jgi:hypothetical protein
MEIWRPVAAVNSTSVSRSPAERSSEGHHGLPAAGGSLAACGRGGGVAAMCREGLAASRHCSSSSLGVAFSTDVPGVAVASVFLGVPW